MLQRSPEWHAVRKGKLTASRVAAALGIDPYMSRPRLWRILTGAEQPRGPSPRMQDGMAAEPYALRDYEVATGQIVEAVGWVPHPSIPWLGASPDGLVGDSGLVEVKCPDPDHWQVRDTVPEYYFAQIQTQLECTQRDWCDYWQWNQRTGETVLIHCVRDPFWWLGAMPGLIEFWQYVETKTVPPRMKKKEKETA